MKMVYIGSELTKEIVESELANKKVSIETTCAFFPELNGMEVTVLSCQVASNGEPVLSVRIPNGRKVSVGARMAGLKMTVL